MNKFNNFSNLDTIYTCYCCNKQFQLHPQSAYPFKSKEDIELWCCEERNNNIIQPARETLNSIDQLREEYLEAQRNLEYAKCIPALHKRFNQTKYISLAQEDCIKYTNQLLDAYHKYDNALNNL